MLRYWEQEFTQLKPVKRRGNRRYYQHHEVLLIRRIRDLLYEQGFTINGARHRLESEVAGASRAPPPRDHARRPALRRQRARTAALDRLPQMRQELEEIRQLLGPDAMIARYNSRFASGRSAAW